MQRVLELAVEGFQFYALLVGLDGFGTPPCAEKRSAYALVLKIWFG